MFVIMDIHTCTYDGRDGTKEREKNFFIGGGGRGRKEIKTCRHTDYISYYIHVINIIFSNFIVELKQFISLIRTHHTHTVGKQVLCYIYVRVLANSIIKGLPYRSL